MQGQFRQGVRRDLRQRSCPRRYYRQAWGGFTTAAHAAKALTGVSAKSNQMQANQHDLRSKAGRHSADVMGRTDGVNIERNEAQGGEPMKQIQGAGGIGSTPGRGCHPRCAGRVDEIHIEAEIDGPCTYGAPHIGKYVGQPTPAEFIAEN